MKNNAVIFTLALLAGGSCGQPPPDAEEVVSAATMKVSSASQLEDAVAGVRAGDTVLVADGSYDLGGGVTVNRQGTSGKPIIIAAENTGGAEIRGNGGITLGSGAAFVEIRGFHFRNAASSLSMPSGSNHCRYTENTFELTGTGTYLTVSGDDHQVDHNLFQNKSTQGQMLSIQGPGGSAMAQRTWVHHNHFRNFKAGNGNNFETVRIGLSGRSLSSASTLFERNLFTQCNGENEIISNKSSANTYRFNTIRDSNGSLTLRHGNRCLVYGNYLSGTGGIRFFGDDHKIFSNHLTGNNPAIQVGNGDGEVADGDKLTSHDRPDGCEVSFNTLVDNDSNISMSGRSGGLGATDLLVANNIIQGGGAAASIRGPLPGASWRGNILFGTGAGDMPSSGFRSADPRLGSDSRGEHHLSAGSPAVGAAQGGHPSPAVDMDGQAVGGDPDVGADEVSGDQVTEHLLAPGDVGPGS
jgi:poly(beta-D-mannuronate) lyase